MSIQAELAEELKAAIRSGDTRRKNVIRAIETDVTRRRAEPGFSGEVDDALYRDVIGAFVKKMNKAKEEYEAAGERGAAMVEQLDFEVTYLSRWLPKKLDEEETRSIVTEAIASLGITDAKQAGRVVGYLMKEHGEQLDGALVNRLVRAELE